MEDAPAASIARAGSLRRTRWRGSSHRRFWRFGVNLPSGRPASPPISFCSACGNDAGALPTPPESGNGAIAIVNPTPPPSSTPGCATLSPSKLRQFTALLLGRASHPNVVSLLIVDGLVDEGGCDRSLITKRKRRPEQDLLVRHTTATFFRAGSLFRSSCAMLPVAFPDRIGPSQALEDPSRGHQGPRGSLPPARVSVRTCLGRQLANQDTSRRAASTR